MQQTGTLTSEVQKRQHKVTPPRPGGGGVRTSAGCHDPPRPGGSRTEGVNYDRGRQCHSDM